MVRALIDGLLNAIQTFNVMNYCIPERIVSILDFLFDAFEQMFLQFILNRLTEKEE
jgi:hypothetical protein